MFQHNMQLKQWNSLPQNAANDKYKNVKISWINSDPRPKLEKENDHFLLTYPQALPDHPIR